MEYQVCDYCRKNKLRWEPDKHKLYGGYIIGWSSWGFNDGWYCEECFCKVKKLD